MIRTIDGVIYLMRDQRPVAQLRELYAAYCFKYKSALTFPQWLAQRGKVSLSYKGRAK